jgi:hypothetical protein
MPMNQNPHKIIVSGKSANSADDGNARIRRCLLSAANRVVSLLSQQLKPIRCVAIFISVTDTTWQRHSGPRRPHKQLLTIAARAVHAG